MLFLSLPSTGTGKGTSMLTDHFRDPRTLDRIQSTAAAPYLDVFADAPTKAGYKRTTIQRYLGAAAHLSFWQQSRARLLMSRSSYFEGLAVAIIEGSYSIASL